MVDSFEHVTLGQRVYFGSGAAEANVLRALEALGRHRVLLIAGESSAAVADRVAELITPTRRILRVVQHVPISEVEKARALAADGEVDVIVTIGGGSATGLGKAVALSTSLPVIAVPTTFAGSEATDVWGITRSGRKETGSDERVLPAIVIYDAELTQSLPSSLAVASGLNAVAHAVDGLRSPHADPINRALGMAGLRALLPGLRLLASSPHMTSAREEIMYGAYLAAVAFASAGSGLHHKICHVLGGAFNLPHAPMHSIVLPYVTAFNLSSSPAAEAALTELFPMESPAVALDALRRELGSPKSLAEIGLKEQEISRAAALVFPDVPPSNPRPVSIDALTSIISDAWIGAPITKEPL